MLDRTRAALALTHALALCSRGAALALTRALTLRSCRGAAALALTHALTMRRRAAALAAATAFAAPALAVRSALGNSRPKLLKPLDGGKLSPSPSRARRSRAEWSATDADRAT